MPPVAQYSPAGGPDAAVPELPVSVPEPPAGEQTGVDLPVVRSAVRHGANSSAEPFAPP